MTAYNNDPEFKATSVNHAIRHRDFDLLVTGVYVRELAGHHYSDRGGSTHNIVKGCSVGCDAYDITGRSDISDIMIHQVTAQHFGFPVWLEHLRDKLYEGLPDYNTRANWHVNIKLAIPCGFTGEQFEQVRLKLLLDMLSDNTDALNDAVFTSREVLPVVQQVREALQGAAAYVEASIRLASPHTLKTLRATLLARTADIEPAVHADVVPSAQRRALRTLLVFSRLVTTETRYSAQMVQSAMAASARYNSFLNPSTHRNREASRYYAAKLISLFEGN